MQRRNLQTIKRLAIIRKSIVVKEGLNNFLILAEHLNAKLGVFPLSIWDLGELPIEYMEVISKMTPLFTHTKNGEIIEGVYKTSFDGHIYIRKVSVHFCEIKILYTPEQFDEVKFFINRLYKINDARD